MRKSHQKGWVVVRVEKWYGYFRRTVCGQVTNAPVTDVVPIVLGLKHPHDALPCHITQPSLRFVNRSSFHDNFLSARGHLCPESHATHQRAVSKSEALGGETRHRSAAPHDGLLFKRHAAQQIGGAFLRRELRISIRRVGGWRGFLGKDARERKENCREKKSD